MRHRLFHTDSFRHAALNAALFAGAMAVLVAVVFFLLDRSFKANLMREVNDDLAALHAAYTTAAPGNEVLEVKEIIDDRVQAPDADDAFVLQRDGVRIAGNLPVMTVRTGVFSTRLPLRNADRDHAPEFMGRGMMLPGRLYIFAGRNLDQIEATEKDILVAFGTVLIACLLLALGAGVLLSQTFLTRVDAVTDTCRTIMSGKFSERIPVHGRSSEFERLGAAINAMLDRIEALMASLRQVSTDIAHDMRTPLTHLRHRLERARIEASQPGDYAAAIDGAVTECDKLLAVFTALLRIAQIEAGARRAEFCDVDLQALAEKLRDIYGPVMDDCGRRFHVEADPVRPIRGDAQLLLQLASNLINNAMTHTPDGCDVSLWCTERNGAPALIVADRGPGIPPEDYAKVLRRFYRREASRTKPGSGLGLALVAAVADLHQAALIFEDNVPGLRVVVQFGAPGDISV